MAINNKINSKKNFSPSKKYLSYNYIYNAHTNGAMQIVPKIKSKISENSRRCYIKKKRKEKEFRL